jgi:lipoprotein-anchoring transpeptidase ErfK/SrfK
MQHSPRALRVSAVATAVVGLLALATPVGRGLAADPPDRGAVLTTVPSMPFTGPATDTVTRTERAVRTARAAATEPRAVDRKAEAGDARLEPALLVDVPTGGLVARRKPRSSADTIGRVVDRSRYYGVPTVAWVEKVSADGRWGRVELPYVWPRTDGWVRLEGLTTGSTRIEVEVDLSAHRLTVRRRGAVLFRAAVATGRSSSPTPPGEYFVTDRVPFPAGSAYGSFAFGISGIQPRLPAGWGGGDQLAIHGTNAPWTIGTDASAGCLRASEATLAKLKPLLQLGTPVVIVP